MRRLVAMVCVLAFALTLGTVALLAPSPAPQAAAPCIDCPLVPLPDECPTCYEWVPGTCRKCAHCERIRGCRT